ncbi:putative pentatricopeptide repeat-containing protein [Drosera capensis]
MRHHGVFADGFTFPLVIRACASSICRWEWWGKNLHSHVLLLGFQDNLHVANELLILYGKLGRMDFAEKLFVTMPVKSHLSWNMMLSGYSQNYDCSGALKIFRRMEVDDWEPNAVSWTSLISTHSRCGHHEETLNLFGSMRSRGVGANGEVLAVVLSSCADLTSPLKGKTIHAGSDCGCKEALFRDAAEKHMDWLRGGEERRPLVYLEEWELHGHAVRVAMDGDILVGNGLINMCTKCGSLDKGWLVFEKMGSRDLISWNSMISGYGMHGYGDKALETFEQMIKGGIEPDGVTFTALISACGHSGLVAKGRNIFNDKNDVFGIPPGMDQYACVVDLLSRAGLKEEARELVNSLPIRPNTFVLGYH